MEGEETKGEGNVTKPMSYVGIKPCGCVTAACVNFPGDKETAKFVADLIRRGYTVEHKDTEWVRANLRRCTHETKQGVLPSLAVGRIDTT